MVAGANSLQVDQRRRARSVSLLSVSAGSDTPTERSRGSLQVETVSCRYWTILTATWRSSFPSSRSAAGVNSTAQAKVSDHLIQGDGSFARTMVGLKCRDAQVGVFHVSMPCSISP